VGDLVQRAAGYSTAGDIMDDSMYDAGRDEVEGSLGELGRSTVVAP
jgi:hypothetical protein